MAYTVRTPTMFDRIASGDTVSVVDLEDFCSDCEEYTNYEDDSYLGGGITEFNPSLRELGHYRRASDGRDKEIQT